MKRVLVLSLALAAFAVHANPRPGDLPAVVQQLNGSPTGTGTGQSISVSTTSATQSTAFKGGEVVQVVNDGSSKMYCRPVTASDGTATTSNGVPIAADASLYWTLASNETHIACITSSGSTTARLYVYR